jgi:hypothetical protein
MINTRIKNLVLSSVRKNLTPEIQKIVEDCGNPYVVGKIREELNTLTVLATEDDARRAYEHIATLAVNGAALCVKKKG